MKKHIFIFLIIIGGLVSCETTSTNSIKSITTHVETAELLITKYDSNVLSALDNKKYSYIYLLSKSALDSLNTRIYDLQDLIIKEPLEDELRNAAVNYIQSMQSIISAEAIYSSIKDTTSEKTILWMDTRNRKAIDKTEQAYSKYNEALAKVSK